MFTKIFRISLILLAVSLVACNPITYLFGDPFYKHQGDFDEGRFPLIKPYEAVILYESEGWTINLHVSPDKKDIYYFTSIPNAEKIAVQDGVIMVYSPYMAKVREEVGQKQIHWFVMIPAKEIETGFDNEPDFTKYIRGLGIDNPNWLDPHDLARKYYQTSCLDWIPACK